MDKFRELKAAAMAATSGPWEWFTSNSMARLSSIPSGQDGDVISAFLASDGVPCVSVSQPDMAFIAAANPAVVLALLARIANLEASLATPLRLPDVRQSSSGDRYQWPDGVHNYRLDVISMLLGAGLTVAVEGVE
ncbi:ead/Ea22-like family protein [Serratia ureilytica]|uniref:hypothetical protein n=1 Tax=Serratia ureilytica TaxID=300181 RepID=UPI003FA6F1DD